MKEKKMVPKIRFPGFTEPWEQRKFSDLYTRVSQKNDLTFGENDIISVANMYFKKESKITDLEYLKTYNVFRVGDIAFEGNKSKNFAHGRFVENTIGDGIISHVFDVFRPITQYDLFYWQYAINNETVMGKVLSRCTKSSTMMTNLVANDFLKESIKVPKLSEQQAIGKLFVNLDTIITLHQRKLDDLKELKKFLLQKMFPRNGEAFPEIRFPGFTDPWEQRKFSELYVHSSEKNDGSIGIEKNITVATMQYKPDIRVTTDDYLKTYYTFQVGDIAFEGHQSKEFRYGRFVENDIGDGIVSHIFAVFRPVTQYDLSFWKYAINNERIMRSVLSRSTKASTMMHDLVPEDFLNEYFLVPTIEEQQKIGALLNHLHNLITLHQRKLDDLKELKKGLLQQMFV